MGSSNRLEIAARDGSAAQALEVGRGAAVHVASAA
jgi:S-adenosylmethionine hydrolase